MMAWKIANPEVGALSHEFSLFLPVASRYLVFDLPRNSCVVNVNILVVHADDIKGNEGDCKSYEPFDTYKQVYHLDEFAFLTSHFCDEDGKIY